MPDGEKQLVTLEDCMTRHLAIEKRLSRMESTSYVQLLAAVITFLALAYYIWGIAH